MCLKSSFPIQMNGNVVNLFKPLNSTPQKYCHSSVTYSNIINISWRVKNLFLWLCYITSKCFLHCISSNIRCVKDYNGAARIPCVCLSMRFCILQNPPNTNFVIFISRQHCTLFSTLHRPTGKCDVVVVKATRAALFLNAMFMLARWLPPAARALGGLACARLSVRVEACVTAGVRERAGPRCTSHIHLQRYQVFLSA